MIIYLVRKDISGPRYIDQQGYGSFQPVPMDRDDAEHAAYRTGGVVEKWVDGELVRQYRMGLPDLPPLELVA